MYAEHKPEDEIARWVECTWSIKPSVPVRGFPVRPDGCVDLLYSHAEGLAVVGPMTREQRFDLRAEDVRIGLRFRPGMARSFLRIGAAELCDRVLPLGDVIGNAARDLRDRLDASLSTDECREILLQAVKAAGLQQEAVHRAIDAMTRFHGEVNVDWVADQAGMSARQFQRRCKEESGLAPKQLARILRFRRACRLAERGESWLRVAAEAGYFDQAHLIRDFREFTGTTPVSDFSKTGEAGIG